MLNVTRDRINVVVVAADESKEEECDYSKK